MQSPANAKSQRRAERLFHRGLPPPVAAQNLLNCAAYGTLAAALGADVVGAGFDFLGGVRRAGAVYKRQGMESFVPWCHSIHLATDSGNEGHHGLVTDLLDVNNYDIVLTCGPMVMMRGVAKLCAAAGVPCLASLEKKMACGLGACLGCTCHTKIGPVTVCKDGPVFNAQEVFD